MPLVTYRRGDIWHYRGTVAGRRLRGSTGTTDEATAQRIAAETETRAWKHRLDGPEAVLTFAQAAILYRGAGKSTRHLERVEDYWRDRLVKDITPGAIRQAAIVLYPRGSGATRNRQGIVPTQAVINHAADLGLCHRLRMTRFKVVHHEKTPADWEWVSTFMSAAPPHLGALACFMLLTGARISEALRVRWKDVDLGQRRVIIRMGKLGGEERVAHLPPPLVVAIGNCARDRETVFRYVDRRSAAKSWTAAVKRASLPPLSFHSCRHGFATALLRAKVDPVTVAKRGGWKNVQHVFATYGHAAEDLTVTDLIADTNLAQADTATGENVIDLKAVRDGD